MPVDNIKFPSNWVSLFCRDKISKLKNSSYKKVKMLNITLHSFEMQAKSVTPRKEKSYTNITNCKK